MRIALIAPPFIAVPPANYGGTELFIALLARGLHARDHDVIVYANGQSRLPCRVRWRYPWTDWPLDDLERAALKNYDHTSWAIDDASRRTDVIHLNDVVGVPFTRFVDRPVVLTLHHPHDPAISEQYARYPDIEYVAIGAWLARREQMPRIHVVHHGISVGDYVFSEQKDSYAAFLGRMAPCKGPHLAIEAARRAGIRLKLAGEVQPIYRDYWEQKVLPLIDGCQIEYVGEVNREQKNELLSRARALLFPIQWEEPFGLVMIEAMACGTPVLAFSGGAVEEVVRDGVNGWICRDTDDMADRLAAPQPAPVDCRDHVARHFSVDQMVDRYLGIYERLAPAEPAPLSSGRAYGRRDPGSRSVLHPGDGLEGGRAPSRPPA
jgi:glycosyltransferase involved in cell wall biosynthesis